MAAEFTVNLRKIVERYKLEIITCHEGVDKVEVESTDVLRPGLQVTGFLEYFDPKRIQIYGKAELTYLKKLPDEEIGEHLANMFKLGVPAIIVTRGLEVPDAIKFASVEYGVPVLRTKETTSHFMSMLISFLNVELGERITKHGVLVEVYGEGILILGESGVGKSETAMELIKRGHRLIADDAVEIKKVSAISLVGTAPEIIRHFIELRGIGIVDVRNIFGMGAVKETEKIDLVISLEQWDEHKKYDRLGLENDYINILDIDLPHLTIPVRPGRNLAVIIEIAAMNHRQQNMGYNAAEELNERLTKQMQGIELSGNDLF